MVAQISPPLVAVALVWILAFLLSGGWRLIPKSQDSQVTQEPPNQQPRRTSLYMRYLRHRAIPHRTPIGADPGWCYLNRVAPGHRQALSGLGRVPSSSKVLKAIDRLGAVLLPCLVTVQHGICPVHNYWDLHSVAHALLFPPCWLSQALVPLCHHRRS